MQEVNYSAAASEAHWISRACGGGKRADPLRKRIIATMAALCWPRYLMMAVADKPYAVFVYRGTRCFCDKVKLQLRAHNGRPVAAQKRNGDIPKPPIYTPALSAFRVMEMMKHIIPKRTKQYKMIPYCTVIKHWWNIYDTLDHGYN